MTVSCQGNSVHLLQGGDFEKGLTGWTTGHSWYEAGGPGKGGGISSWSLDESIAHSGKFSLKVVGQKNRGLAMQVLRLVPDTYRVSGWIRTENLGEARASILVEFLDRTGKWLSGIPVGEVSGTQDWTLISKDITFPENAFEVHLDLLTDRPNEGIAWFDDVALTRTHLQASPPGPVRFTVGRKPANSGSLSISWESHRPDPGTARYDIYIEEEPFRTLGRLRPKASAPWWEKEAVISRLKDGRRYWVSVVAADTDGRFLKEVKPLEALCRDTLPPRPVKIQAAAILSGSQLRLAWQPHPWDSDIAGFDLWIAPRPRYGRKAKSFPATRREAIVSGIRRKGPVYVGMAAVDRAGNRGEAVWQAVDRLSALPRIKGEGPEAPYTIWVDSPLANIFRDTPPPARMRKEIDLLGARNETECAQIVVSARVPVKQLRVVFGDLRRQDGIRLPADAAYQFVGYLRVEKNSTATPPKELLRKAPADFPDPFLEEREVAVPAGENQPIFLSLRVPKQARPGRYRGEVWIVTEHGRTAVPLQLEVMPFALPDQLPLYVTNWFNVSNFAIFHKVPLWSEDFWKVLRLYAREMHRGHQNVVLTPLDLVKIYMEEDGGFSFDFSDFDRWVKLFESEGVAERIELSHLGGRTTGDWECPTFSISPRPAIDRKTGQSTTVEIEQFLPALEQHLQSRGWLEKTVLHIGDEPIMVNVASWREQSERAHRAAPRLKRIDAIHVPYKEVADHLEVLVPQLNYFEQWYEGYREAQQKGRAELWFYIAWVPQGHYPNRLIDYPAIKTRLIHWINFLWGATGYLHWGLNFWTDFKEMGFAPGDNWILYPGEVGPRSCLRWEAMRDGLEDLAYFHRLARLGPNGQRRAQELGHRMVRAITDYDRDPERLEAIRREVAREIVRLQPRAR